VVKVKKKKRTKNIMRRKKTIQLEQPQQHQPSSSMTALIQTTNQPSPRTASSAVFHNIVGSVKSFEYMGRVEKNFMKQVVVESQHVLNDNDEEDDEEYEYEDGEEQNVPMMRILFSVARARIVVFITKTKTLSTENML
jgi:hypothetical protein